MKVTFYSGFMMHHQEPFSLKMQSILGDDYKFVACESIDPERLKLGYSDNNKKYDFIVRAYESDAQKYIAEKLAIESDVVIFGSGDEYYLKKRIQETNKLTFRYSERLLKKGNNLIKYIPRCVKLRVNNPQNAKMYVLCASAYTAADYARFGLYKNRTYKWGYFPETECIENIDEILEKKEPNSILWCGRFIDWKHPDLAVEIARKLKADGYDFKLNLIGTGMMENQLKEMVNKYHLSDCVKIFASMTPNQIREQMKNAQIYLFTSDFQEGWGAVLNEAMNSGCACIANHAIGSVPFLVSGKNNALIYKNNDFDDLYSNVQYLINNTALCNKLGKNAYETIVKCWNAEFATERLIELCEGLLAGKSVSYEAGPCSEAKIIKNDWYK